MKTTLKERFLQIADYKGFSVRKLEEYFSLNRGNISNLSNNSSVGSDKLSNIIDTCPELNIEWLITGEGDMFKTSTSSEIPCISINLTEQSESLPLIPYDALAGYLSHDNHGVTIDMCDAYKIPDFISKGAEYLIRVSGSSMYPKYSNGDILACKKINDILFFQWGKVYVIDSSQGALVKRIFEDMDNPENILCISENKENYHPFSLPKSDIRSISIVIGAIKLE